MRQLILLISLWLINYVFAGYQPQSPYLKNPQLAIGYVDSCATFWMNAYDPVYGGFYTEVKRDGSVNPSGDKNLLSLTRNAYGFSRAFMLTGDKTYLTYANYALEFMYKNAWDETHDGWMVEFNRQGKWLDSYLNQSRWSFMQHYALLGITAMYEATRNESHLNWLKKGFQSNETHLWDARPQYLGYFNWASNDWKSAWDKGFNATIDALTTHLFNLHLMALDKIYDERFFQLSDNILDHFLPTMNDRKIGFAINYNAKWEPKDKATIRAGQILKTAWCLAQAYLACGEEKYKDAAHQLMNECLEKGAYDKKNGAPFADFDGITGEMKTTTKSWWQVEQGFTAGIINHYLFTNDTFLEMADESLDFYMQHFVDSQYAEVFETTDFVGQQTGSTDKGNAGKAGYHSIEFGYYLYLYGNLLYHQKPATLFYHLKAKSTAQEIILTPVELDHDQLVILEVKHNGDVYRQFDAYQRTLVLEPGVEGIFEVTFGIKSAQAAVAQSSKKMVQQIHLHQNFPNPFNMSTRIRYELPQQNHVVLSIYNILGREILVLVDDVQAAGTHAITWNGLDRTGNPVPSGMYFYQLMTPEATVRHKLLLTK